MKDNNLNIAVYKNTLNNNFYHEFTYIDWESDTVDNPDVWSIALEYKFTKDLTFFIFHDNETGKVHGKAIISNIFPKKYESRTEWLGATTDIYSIDRWVHLMIEAYEDLTDLYTLNECSSCEG